METSKAQVIIVGGGPVGLTLALVLARLQVRSLVIEPRLRPTPRDESRAITWQPRGIELLEWLGLYEAIASNAVRRTRHAFWVNGREALVLQLDRANSLHPYTLDLPQGDSEVLIEAAAEATGLVEIRRGHEAVGMIAWDDFAAVRVRRLAGDEEYVTKAPWGVLCDGYHSPMRKALGISVKYTDYGADSAVADFESAVDIVPPSTSVIVLDRARPFGFFRFGPNRWRLIYRINAGESREEMTRPEKVLELVTLHAREAQPSRVLWASAFRLGQQQSAAYRRGRWVLAGDAAHGMGPSAGAGLQVGALGAWRLGWRLALALHRHDLAEALLNDYAREQRSGSEQVQFENGMIFRNLALTSSFLTNLRGAILRLIGHFPSLAGRMTDSMTLVGQHLPVEKSCDWSRALNGARSITMSGEWKAGRRVPLSALRAYPSLRRAGTAMHTIIPVVGLEAETLAKAIAKISPVPAQVTKPLSLGPERSVVAVVRPDQEVAALVGPP